MFTLFVGAIPERFLKKKMTAWPAGYREETTEGNENK